MTRARSLSCKVTAHELTLLAIYRALSPPLQRAVAGLVYHGLEDDEAALRFRDEALQLGVHNLEAGVLRPFVEAAAARK